MQKKTVTQSSKKTPLQKDIQRYVAAKTTVPIQSDVEVTLTIKSPPRIVRSIRDLIYWEYAKLIAHSSGLNDNWGFIVNRFKQLKEGKIKWKDANEDVKKQLLRERKCIYCGSESGLSIDHIIPISKGGPDIPANIILACKKCNSSKGNKDVFEWYYIDKKATSIPGRIWKRYLKLVWDFHVLHRSLDRIDLNEDGKLDLLDLSAIFHFGK